MKQFNEVKDSGKRQSFNTGSVRDTADGKGCPHLIAGEVISKVIKFKNISNWTKPEGGTNNILNILQGKLFEYASITDDKNNWFVLYNNILLICYLFELTDKLWTNAYRRLAVHYQNGAKKYSKNNWRLGQPVSRYYDSSMRHLWDIIDDKTDEDHLAALLWNQIAIVQTKFDCEAGLLLKELNDFPFTIEEVFGKNNLKRLNLLKNLR